MCGADSRLPEAAVARDFGKLATSAECAMKIVLGSDHRGVEAKRRLMEMLRNLGHDVTDVGPADGESVDYPDYAAFVARQVSEGRSDRGILICGTGIGMCITANKFKGVR